MKKIVLTFAMVLMAFFTGTIYAQVGIGTMTPDKSAALDVTADSLGVLVPRMTENDRDNIQNPSNGLLIYNTDESCFNVYNWSETDSTWTSLCGGMAKAKFTVLDCSSITVNGAYIEGSPLNGSNYLSVKVAVEKAGSYTFTATTTNGYGFTGSGTILDAPATVTLTIPGQGTPKVQNQTPGDLVTFNSSGGDVNCTNLTIPVFPPTATYEMICGSAKANGAYVKGKPLGPTNTITLTVNVTDIKTGGSWSVASSVNNGISFKGSSTFTSETMQQITLYGTGTPNTTQPITLTLTSNSRDGESTCTVKVTVAYPRMSVLGIGYGNIYEYNPADSTSGGGHIFHDMMVSSNNFGTNDNSTVKAEGFTFTDGGDDASTTTLTNYLLGANPPDIVIFGYPFVGDATAQDVLNKYLQKHGVILFFAEADAMVQRMMRALFGDNTITAGGAGIPTAWGGTGGTRYVMPILPSDPIINGPFGDLGGLYWGEDFSTSVAVSGIQYNPNATVYSTFNPTSTGGVTAFRHNSMNFVYCGDGGFNSSTDPGPNLCPFVLDANQRPTFKANYGPGSGGTTGPVYNAVFTANAIAWALDRAMNNGINPH